MDKNILSLVIDALARYEVQSRWPSLKPDRVEENVSIMRSDAEIVNSAKVALTAFNSIEPDTSEEAVRRDTWRRAGVNAAADYVRRHADRYVVYALPTSSIERHVDQMQLDLAPGPRMSPPSPESVVRRALATDAVTRRWPSLREDLVETNIRMMTSDNQITRHAEIAIAIIRAIRHAEDPDHATMENRNLISFQQGVEIASRYFVTLSAKDWIPRTIGWGLKDIADAIKRHVHPN